MSAQQRQEPEVTPAVLCIRALCAARRPKAKPKPKELLTPEARHFIPQPPPRRRPDRMGVALALGSPNVNVALSTDSESIPQPRQVPHHMTRITSIAHSPMAANHLDETANIFAEPPKWKPSRFQPRKIHPAPRARFEKPVSTVARPTTQELLEDARLETLRYIEKSYDARLAQRRLQFRDGIFQIWRKRAMARRCGPELLEESYDSESGIYGTYIPTTYASERSTSVARSPSPEPVQESSDSESGSYGDDVDDNDSVVSAAPSNVSETPSQNESTWTSTLLYTWTSAKSAVSQVVQKAKQKVPSAYEKARAIIGDTVTFTGKTITRKVKEACRLEVFNRYFLHFLIPGSAPPFQQPVVDSRDDTTEEDSRVDLDLSVLKGFPAFHPPERNGPYFAKRRALNYDEFQKVGYGS